MIRLLTSVVEIGLLAATTFGASAQILGPAPKQPMEAHAPSLPATLDPLLTAPAPVFLLEPDDLISVDVYDVEAFKVKARIQPDGTIELPLAGKISVAGLTITQAQDAISSLLRERHLVLQPGVTVEAVESPSWTISVSGEVNKPGTFAAFGRHTLAQMIAIAEGEKLTASSVVTIIRPGATEPFYIDLGPDPTHSPYAQIPIYAGDIIEVPHIGRIFVLGAVGKQGTIDLKSYSLTTVSKAIAESSGIGFQASADDARLVRTQDGKMVAIRLHVSRILAGKDYDPILQNDDILYIPTNQSKAALKGGATSVIAGLATAFLYTR